MNQKQALILEILRAHRAGLFLAQIAQLSDGALTKVTLASDLALLQDQELVISETVAQAVGPPRERYRLTRKGERTRSEATVPGIGQG
jgi:DNA-binding PadR family transcriptional regulator